jgi:drug/metabolite transporter (DMT)-like permease
MVNLLLGAGFAILAALGLAVQSLSVRLSTKDQSVTEVVAFMFVVNALVLVPVTAIVYYPAYGITVASLVAFAIAGVLGSLLARVCLFTGIHRLGASRAEPLKSIFPLVAVLSAVVVLGEAMSVALLVGIVLLVGGAVGVSLDARQSPVTATGRRVWIDLSYPLAAAVLLGADPVFTKLGLAEGTPALVGLTIRVLAAAGGFGVYLLWRRTRQHDALSIHPTRWLLLASLANTVYLGAYLAALARAPVSVVTPILGASPLLVLSASAAFVQGEERVTLRLALAVLVLVVGVVLVLVG